MNTSTFSYLIKFFFICFIAFYFVLVPILLFTNSEWKRLGVWIFFTYGFSFFCDYYSHKLQKEEEERLLEKGEKEEDNPEFKGGGDEDKKPFPPSDDDQGGGGQLRILVVKLESSSFSFSNLVDLFSILFSCSSS